MANRKPTTTTADEFLAIIAHLPFMVVERNQYGGVALMPINEDRIIREATSAEPMHTEHNDLWHALQINANKRGLRARRGGVVWTVNGLDR